MDLCCPICLNIYYKPVSLPCGHTLCQQCLERSLVLSSLACPICRFRLSVWKRRLKDTTSCIDKARENEIKTLFPQYCSKKAEGIDASLNGAELEVLREVSGNHIYLI